MGFSLSQFVQGTHRRKSTSRWISQLKLPYVSPTDHNLPNRFKKPRPIFSGTVRRFLETHPEFRVVLCVDKSERSLYNRLTPLYFPASRAEEEAAIWHLPADIGGPLGEPVDSERQIRIIQNPQHDAMERGKVSKYYEDAFVRQWRGKITILVWDNNNKSCKQGGSREVSRKL